MRYVFVLLMWVTPAAIAGGLGWTGIWGGTSAFSDYLIPIPVAGGIFHVPSFAIATFVVLNLKKWPREFSGLVPIAAIAVFLVAQTMQLDFDRINDWLFTDYDPAGSPFRFGENPLFLFIASDALLLACYSLFVGGNNVRWLYWLVLPIIPIGVVGTLAVTYNTSGPKFEYGFSDHADKRGNKMVVIFTRATYNESELLQWWESDNAVTKPWETSNAENLAVYFSNSMRDIKWRRMENTASVLSTLCASETDQSVQTFPGHHDCFEGRVTFSERLNDSVNNTNTGLGKEIDNWYARARLCDGVVIPESMLPGIELLTHCSKLKKNYTPFAEEITVRHGEDSTEATFVRDNASLLEFPAND